jgi:hypothetical protein
MNPNIIREVEALYGINKNFLSDDGLMEKQQGPAFNRPESRNPLPEDPERYLIKDQLMCIFKGL